MFCELNSKMNLLINLNINLMKTSQEIHVWNTHTYTQSLYEYITSLIAKNLHIDVIYPNSISHDIVIIITSINK